MIEFVGTPTPQCAQLPGFILVDVSGNGVQHMTVNGADDFWVTETVTGSATIQQFDPLSGARYGTTFFGHLEAWFGAEGNRSNFATNDIANFRSSSSVNPTGLSISLHMEGHFNSTAQKQIPPPVNIHMNVSCS